MIGSETQLEAGRQVTAPVQPASFGREHKQAGGSRLVIPISSQLYEIFVDLAECKRMIFVTGLPGVGKSLLIQQLALIANEAGRQVHLLQWRSARHAFETETILTDYPEKDGVTDPAIRKAVGLWARTAVAAWDQTYSDPEHLLIGELPLIGNRLIELAEVHADAAETVLNRDDAFFLVPVPSWEVREEIEAARARTIADPQNEQERRDAAPHVLQALWQELNALARRSGLTKAGDTAPYNPYIYGGVYDALLQHRPHQLLMIDQVLRPRHSVYDLDVVTSELQASPEESAQIMSRVEQTYSTAELLDTVARWHRIITESPKVSDAGIALQLPAPETLPGISRQTSLNFTQATALRTLLSLPLDAGTGEVLIALHSALHALEADDPRPVIVAEAAKFDIYDSYFNITRSGGESGIAFLYGLLQAYGNVLQNLAEPPHTLTIVELPMLRIALETTLRTFLTD